jgi:hypothetical protein
MVVTSRSMGNSRQLGGADGGIDEDERLETTEGRTGDQMGLNGMRNAVLDD